MNHPLPPNRRAASRPRARRTHLAHKLGLVAALGELLREVRGQLAPLGALHAVVGPELLLVQDPAGVLELDVGVDLVAGVGRDERDVALGVVVLSISAYSRDEERSVEQENPPATQ